MKNMRLGMKIGLGFGILILLAGLPSVLAVTGMIQVRQSSLLLAQEYIPLVRMASSVERYSQMAMYNIRGYVTTHNAEYLKNGRMYLEEVRTGIAEAGELAGRSRELASIGEPVERASVLLTEYEAQLTRIEMFDAEVLNRRARLDTVTARLAREFEGYAASQFGALAKAAPGEVPARARRLEAIMRLRGRIEAIRILELKARAERNVLLLKEAIREFDLLAEELGELRKITDEGADLEKLDDVLFSAENLKVGMVRLQETDEAMDEAAKKGGLVAEELLQTAQGLALDGMERTLEMADGTSSSLTLAVQIVAAGLLAAVVLALLAGRFIARSITRPIAAAVAFARSVASGDLESTIDIDQQDEVGVLVRSLRDMVATLKDNLADVAAKGEVAEEQSRRAVDALELAREQEVRVKDMLERNMALARQVGTISERVSTASEELTDQVQSTSDGAVTQQERIDRTAVSMEQMTASILEVARSAGEAAGRVDQARERASAGAAVVDEAVAAIARVSDMTLALRQNMHELGRQAESIGQVMGVINDIADQTNLLALNAAIEAARAGDAGRGFAVVADEVRKLAEKTMQATHEVGSTIGAIQAVARQNLAGMEQASVAVEQATSLAGQSGVALGEIVRLVSENAGQVQTIAAAAEQQSASSDEINRALEEVSQVVASTAQGMAQSSQAVQELTHMAMELNRLVRSLQS